ncbi:hypothetical protein BBJ28_00023264, partial [Nothophytophthora sp. Chile5]
MPDVSAKAQTRKRKMENVKRGKLKLKNGSKLKLSASHKPKKHKKKHLKRSKEEDESAQKPSNGEEADAGEDELTDMTPAQRRHAEHRKKRVRIPASTRYIDSTTVY